MDRIRAHDPPLGQQRFFLLVHYKLAACFKTPGICRSIAVARNGSRFRDHALPVTVLCRLLEPLF